MLKSRVGEIMRIGVAATLVALGSPSFVVGAEEQSVGTGGSVSPGAAPGDGAWRHLLALQEIAAANGGNRAAGTPGYDRSADYVAARLKEAGYAVRFEEFEFPFFEERTPPILTIAAPQRLEERAPAAGLRTLANAGSGDVSARLRDVNLALGADPPAASASGCEARDFGDFERGAIALVRRGTCTFQVKVDNAVAAGAAGVVVMNEGTENRKDAFSGQLSKAASVPVVGVPYEFGRTLAAAAREGASVHLAVDAMTGKRATRNVLGETAIGSEGPTIMVGAHLDSVPAGPGINDNGSGSAAVLETAQQLAPELTHGGIGVRFAFWGAEERGLLGSRHHVESLSEEQRQHIALYINLDMVGSPNFGRFVQGDAKEGAAATARRELLADFRERNLAVEERGGGRTGTDDASFSQKGIPTIGLHTGANARKSESEATAFGGVAGQPFDACYHRACDTVDNIDRDVLEQNTRALERALHALTAAPGK
jgi:Zn-dependent M28 family amino/carboxypeptidase